MAEKVNVGDKVEWGTSQGKTRGVVKKKLTSPTKIKGHKVAASNENPEYLVESSRSGDKAAHKPKSLKKVSSTKTSSSAKKSAKSASARKKSSTSSVAKKSTANKSAARKSGSSKSAAAKKKSGGSTAKKSTRKSSAKKSSGSMSSKKSTKSSTAKKSAGKGDAQVIDDFKKMVNMTPSALEKWLGTEESKKVGFKDEGKGESVGHESGRKILKIKAKGKDKYTDDDVKHIHKVVGYIKRHLAQKPKGDISASNWRYSLMNWGHDPTKK